VKASPVLLGCLLCLAPGFVSAVGEEAKVTPVQKVVELMQGMLAKGEEDKHQEQVQFAAYKQFCEDTAAEKTTLIAEAEEHIEVLKADIQKFTATAEKLTKEIAGHDEDISVWEGDKKAATSVRDMEHAEFNRLHKDYSESVDALERAIAVLKKQAYTRKQAESFVQVENLQKLSLIPEQAKRAIQAFIQEDPDEGLAVAAPEAGGYEFQSHGVVEMLEGLLDKFISERTALEKEEDNSKHAFDMLMQELTAQINEATRDRTEKAENKAKTLEKKATAEGDLGDTTETMEADKTYLADLTATCEQKATDFEARQTLRTEEIEAVNKAIEIISSGDVAGAADKHLPSLLQVQQKGSSLVSLRSDMKNSQLKSEMAAEYLKARAHELNSRVLSALATHVAADPFKKVKKMIKDLIVKLMEEANEEAEHKGWCDTELSTNEQTRKEKTEAVELLHAEIDELKASISKLTEDITALSKAIADLDAAMAEATKLRGEEKAKNAVTIEDAGKAQTAVAQALTVLKEFYAKAGEATALLQQQPEAPEIFDKPYKGMGGEAGGVVGMLEVIESDFARLEADTQAAEATAQSEYDTFMTDSKVDKASKTKDVEHKEAKKQDNEQTLVTKQGDLEGTQKELDAALAYFDKLKPSCIDAGVSYEDRVKRREEEIASLQEALKILNGEDLA